MQQRLQRVELLVIDELGFVPFDRVGGELLFNVFADRYERRSTLITTNLAKVCCGCLSFGSNVRVKDVGLQRMNAFTKNLQLFAAQLVSSVLLVDEESHDVFLYRVKALDVWGRCVPGTSVLTTLSWLKFDPYDIQIQLGKEIGGGTIVLSRSTEQAAQGSRPPHKKELAIRGGGWSHGAVAHCSILRGAELNPSVTGDP